MKFLTFNDTFSFFQIFNKIFEFYDYLKIIISFFVCFIFIIKATHLVRSFLDVLKFLYNIAKKMLQIMLSKFLKIIEFKKKHGSSVPITITAITQLESNTKKRKLYKLIETYSTYDEAFNRMKMELDGQMYNFR